MTALRQGFGVHQEVIAPAAKLSSLNLLDESQTAGEALVPDKAKEMSDTSFGTLTAKINLPPENANHEDVPSENCPMALTIITYKTTFLNFY